MVFGITLVTYPHASDICSYVQATYGVTFTDHGMCKWLGDHGFVHKKPKPMPGGADPEKQREFIKEYENLLKVTPINEPVLFCDAVHPTSETRISYG
jgi:hypothetical protein